MALKLGSDDVSFRLGAGEVAAVYLGGQEVWSAAVPATLYFNAVDDNEWTTVGNWWLDDLNANEFAEPAGRLPASVDSVATSEEVNPSGQTVVNLTVFGGGTLTGTLTVTGMATFNNSSTNSGTITGNATFNNDGLNSGTITGNATFNGSSENSGSVNGTATFTGSACNSGNAGTFVPDPPPDCNA
jgi:hypothetical protein